MVRLPTDPFVANSILKPTRTVYVADISPIDPNVLDPRDRSFHSSSGIYEIVLTQTTTAREVVAQLSQPGTHNPKGVPATVDDLVNQNQNIGDRVHLPRGLVLHYQPASRPVDLPRTTAEQVYLA